MEIVKIKQRYLLWCRELVLCQLILYILYSLKIEKKLLSLNQKFFSKIIIDGMILIILNSLLKLLDVIHKDNSLKMG